MEVPRELARVVARLERLASTLAELAQLREVLVARARARERDGAELDDQARLDDVFGRRRRHHHHVGHRLSDLRAGRRSHERPAARADLDRDQPHRLERAQGVAYGHPADAELLRELALGRETVARLEAPGQDRGADLLGDRRGGAGDGDRSEDRIGHAVDSRGPGGCHGLMVRHLC